MDLTLHPRRAPFLLGGILALSAVLQVLFLDREGLGHPYYAAAVQSMGTSWHNFFFASLDPAGFLAVDKPPLGLWLQVAFSKVIGFNSWSLHLPGALASVGSVALLYRLVGGIFGTGAGLLAALILALTPIAVAVGRNITMDGVLVLCILGSAHFFLRAVERGDLRDLLVAALLTGMGFNVKMAQALMAVPAMAVTWVLFARTRDVPTRWVRLALAAAVTAAASLAWVLVVDLTPPERRPFVGSTENDSALELALGHNLRSRVLTPIRRGLPGIATMRRDVDRPLWEPGRTLNARLGPQVSWFLPLVLLGAALAWTRRRSFPQNASLCFWSLWALSNALFFSMSRGVLHAHYLVMMAAPYAVLSALAFMAFRSEGVILKATLALTAVLQSTLLLRTGDEFRWLLVFPAGALVASIAALTIPLRFQRRFVVSALALLFAAPASWSLMPVLWGGHEQLPYAGPRLRKDFHSRMNDYRQKRSAELDALARYLMERYPGDGFLAATLEAQGIGAPLILRTKAPVLVLGGFHGRDRAMSFEEFRDLVRSGRLRYFLSLFGVRERVLSGQMGSRTPDGPNRRILEWVIAVGKPVELPGMSQAYGLVDLEGAGIRGGK